MVSETKYETKFLIVTGLLIVALIIPIFFNLFVQEPQVYRQSVSKDLAGSVRAIASLPPEKTPADNSQLSAISSFDLQCGNKNVDSFEVKNTFIQVKGRNCTRGREGSIEITNKSNGYSASVFTNLKEKYQTDFIPLRHGINEISIRYEVENGQEKETILRVHSSQN
jgi:hypothetical protein